MNNWELKNAVSYNSSAAQISSLGGAGRRLALAALLISALTLTACLGGVMGRFDVTDRDKEIARQMEAPEDVMASLALGMWPGNVAKRKVRDAEACIDYLKERYADKGATFSAVKVAVAVWMTTFDDVTLRVETGPGAGKEIRLKYQPPKDGEEEDIHENYYYYANHEEWERVASEAVLPILERLPEGSWLCDIQMSGQLYTQRQIRGDIKDGWGTGDVKAFIAMERCGFDEAELSNLLSELDAAMGRTGLCCSGYVVGYSGPLSSGEFTLDNIYSHTITYAWRESFYHSLASDRG